MISELPEPAQKSDSVEMVLGAGDFVTPVLQRVVGTVATRAGLPLDRVDEAILIAELIGQYKPPDDVVRVSVRHIAGVVRVRVGPLQPGGGNDLLGHATLPGVGCVIECLADGIVIAPCEGSEFVEVRVGKSAT